MTRCARSIRLLCLLLVLLTGLFCPAQTAGQTPSADKSGSPSSLYLAGWGKGSPQGHDGAAQPQAEPEHTISPQQAQALFNSVDEILAFVSKDTGLPIKEKVKRKLADRSEVEKYITQRMAEDKDAQRLARSAVSLKKFGLLPRDFQLQPFLLGLLKEQVAGFYDAKTKTVYLLNWVDADAQKPVLAHELTHALQDQNYDLDKWSESDRQSKSDQEELELEESQSAREAVIEGQAMVVLLDYMLAPLGRSVADSPAVVSTMKDVMSQGSQTPMFARAPLFLRESLTFPYTTGLDFERQVMAKKGKDGAYKGVFEQPPQDTRQLMQPETYLSDEHVPELTVPDMDAVLKGRYKRYDFGGLGEFDVAMLVGQWYGSQTGASMANAWRGGYYFTYEKDGHKGDPYVLISLTRWASEKDAEQFANLYAGSLVNRYPSVSKAAPWQHGSGEWQTSEGPVEISVKGTCVIAIEGLEADARAQVRQAIERTLTVEPRPEKARVEPVGSFPLSAAGTVPQAPAAQ